MLIPKLLRSFSESLCSLSRPSAHIRQLSLDHPSKRNALSTLLIDQMQSNLIQIKADQDSRVLILSSSVQKVFCAGADLKERALMSQDEVKSFVQKLQATFNMLEDLEIPTIACIDGFALGGGLEMALACDLRVAGPNARVGLVETSIGVIPGAGGTFRLPRAIGLAKAKEMIFTSAIYDSEQAKALDLFSYIGEEPLAKALEIASLVCQNAPVAVKMAKKSVNLAFGLDRTRAMTIEGLCYAQIVNTEDRVEALNAFKEKRKPVFKGK